MGVLGSPLLPLVLSLCLGLLFPSAKCQYPIGKCVTISKIIGAADGGIQANPDIYENDTMYTVSVPVTNNTEAVILRALYKTQPVGFWKDAHKNCTNSVMYELKNPRSKLFEAKWVSPGDIDLSSVQLQAGLTIGAVSITSSHQVSRDSGDNDAVKPPHPLLPRPGPGGT
ncbi:placenta-expressed transcript 1 protein [Camelus dromedarius]|uniref:placenta-expressed transcript 1 protein n=1 Tax=Camelus dromedarius TaxID=9838 RepID=UPI003119DEBF